MRGRPVQGSLRRNIEMNRRSTLNCLLSAAILCVAVAASAQVQDVITVGTTITLTLDPVLTQLTDEGGSAATKETTTAANLALVNGAIIVVAQVPALSDFALIALCAMLALIAFMRLRT